MGKNRIKTKRTKKTNLITNNQQIVLASLSKTRQIEIKKYFKDVILTKHNVDETKEKKRHNQLNAKDLAYHLARLKAISVSAKYKDKFVIGCDQTLDHFK